MNVLEHTIVYYIVIQYSTVKSLFWFVATLWLKELRYWHVYNVRVILYL